MAALNPIENAELAYFPIPGRGEPTRLAYVVAGIPFKDTRVVFGDWGAMKVRPRVIDACSPSLPFFSVPISNRKSPCPLETVAKT